MTETFWNEVWERADLVQIDPERYRQAAGKTEAGLLDLLGDVRGRDVLDIGCGAGKLTTYLACSGARVTAVDLSDVSVQKTLAQSAANGVADRVAAHTLDALRIDTLGATFDLVVGRFILHHVEPFAAFPDVLYRVMRPGGRAVFIENNARNPLLMLARSHLAGRFGIPRYGDDEEHPLEPREVRLLEERFGRVCLHYPDFVFFKKINTYVFRQKRIFRPFLRANVLLDAGVHRYVPRWRPYSYVQLVEVIRDA